MKNYIISILFCVSFFVQFASADIGPKPTTVADIYYNSIKVDSKQISIRPLNCEDSNTTLKNKEPECVSAYPSGIRTYGGTDFSQYDGKFCMHSYCNGYLNPDRIKLEINHYSTKKQYVTEILESKKFHSEFRIDLYDDGTSKVTDLNRFYPSDNFTRFLISLLVTIAIELIVALVFLLIKKLNLRILFSVIIGTLITLPFVWYIFPLLNSKSLPVALAEIFAFVVEANIIYRLNKNNISLKQSYYLSFIINLISFTIGWLLYTYIMFNFFGM